MDSKLFPSSQRGSMELDWLKANFSFSFAEFYNPNLMGFGTLRVLNDDIIAGISGFPPHPHKNYEIITIVMRGTLTHEDSMGNKTHIPHHQIQHMSAGSGIVHSEINEFEEEVNSFQIWIKPQEIESPPFYGQKQINQELLISPTGKNDSLPINQQAYISWMNRDESFEYNNYDQKNIVYIMIVDGSATIENNELFKRDAIGLYNYDEKVLIELKEKTTFLIIEIPQK